MTVLVTGAAGFIGYHVCRALLARDEEVVGLDNLNYYYDVALKRARLGQLEAQRGFVFERIDIADRDSMNAMIGRHVGIRRIVHLAAQAGVRHSLTHPFAYIEANVVGHLVMLELSRGLENFEHLVYASSSSVYGGNAKIPFSVADRVDSPISLYAVTKKTDELMSECYSHLYGIPQTGLRFFTVYGPWGRPDMAIYIFTKAILAGEPIQLFNHGDMKRDFTYVDDIVVGILAALDRPPERTAETRPHRVFNLGNSHSEPLLRVVSLLEEALGTKSERILEPMPPGDVKETYADIDASRRELGFDPTTPVAVGIPRFVEWYRDYHGQ